MVGRRIYRRGRDAILDAVPLKADPFISSGMGLNAKPHPHTFAMGPKALAMRNFDHGHFSEALR